MREKVYCYDCNLDVVPKMVEENNTYTFRNKTFNVKEFVMVCPKCENELFEENALDDSMNKIYDLYLGLFDLSFEKIIKTRTDLNLSQELMSKLLGWSKKSIVRYENAESIPQGEYLNTYMELASNPYSIIKILERQKNFIGEDEYYKILKRLPFFDDYKTINVVSFLLEGNPLYETSLMKNLFAVDFYNHNMFNNPVTNLKYARLPYGPVVDNRNRLYNMMLKNDYMEIEMSDSGTIFVSCFNYDKNLFSEDELNVLKLIKNRFKKFNSKELSDWSHKFIGWKNTKNGEIISYDYAKYLDINI